MAKIDSCIIHQQLVAMLRGHLRFVYKQNVVRVSQGFVIEKIETFAENNIRVSKD